MEIFIGLLFGLLSGGAIFGALFLIKGHLAAGVGNKKATLKSEIGNIDQALGDLGKQADKLVSKAQLESARKIREDAAKELEQTKQTLSEAEKKLEDAQKNVVVKESRQQELKVSKGDEEAKIAEMTSMHATLGSESLGLEQELADSIKQLDSLQGEVELTEKQKAAFDKLSEVLASSAERMRELVTEYDTTYQKVQELMEQYNSLEEEYTRLVEQQLSS